MGVHSLKVTERHLNNAGCCYEYTFVSVPCIARRYTILSAARQTQTQTHMVYIQLDGGRQAGRGQGRSEEGWRVGGSKGRVVARDGGNKGREGGSKEWEGGSDDARQERASVEEGMVEGGLMKGTSEEGTEQGMDGTRERWEGGSERRD